jgi:hypothetical protein
MHMKDKNEVGHMHLCSIRMHDHLALCIEVCTNFHSQSEFLASWLACAFQTIICNNVGPQLFLSIKLEDNYYKMFTNPTLSTVKRKNDDLQKKKLI